MKKEQEIKLQILSEARDLPEGRGLGYHNDQLANQIALELIYNDMVIGTESEYGTACITGIREAGLDYLKNHQPHRKAIAAGKRVVFVLYSLIFSLILFAVVYILNLDSVKEFFSEVFRRWLK